MPGFDNKIVFASNVDFTGNSLTQGTAQITSNGQLLIGSAAGVNGPCLLAGSLTSSDGSITVTNGAGTISLTVTGGSSVGKTITGNTGGALTPSLGNWNILGTGSLTSGGSGNTLTFSLTGLTNHAVLVGSGGATITNIAATANTGAVLQNNSGADPSYSTATYPSTTAQGDLLLSSATNTITALAKDTNSTRYLSNTGTTNNAAWAQVALTTGVSGILPIANGGTDANSFTQSAGIVVFDGTRLVNYAGPQLSSGGIYTNTSQTIFSVYLNTAVSNVTGDGTLYTIIFDTKIKDQGTNFTLASGTFTAPVTGTYQFNIQVAFGNPGTSNSPQAYLTTTGRTFLFAGPPTIGAGTNVYLQGACITTMTAADTAVLKVQMAGSTKTVSVDGLIASSIVTSFSGSLLG